MQPVGRLIDHLDHQRGEHDHEAGERHHEERRPVGGIGEGEVQAAALAARRDLEESAEQPALAAARTAAGETAPGHRAERVIVIRQVVLHHASQSKHRAASERGGLATAPGFATHCRMR